MVVVAVVDSVITDCGDDISSPSWSGELGEEDGRYDPPMIFLTSSSEHNERVLRVLFDTLCNISSAIAIASASMNDDR